MKCARHTLARLLCTSVVSIFLTACSGFYNHGMMGPDYAPLSSEVTTLAAPAENTGTGPQLFCRAGKGLAFIQDDWSSFSDANFILPPQQRVNVTLRSTRGAGAADFQGYFDVDGQKIVFCPVVDGPPGQQVSCSSLYALDEDLKMGIRRTFDIPDFLRAGEITCAYSAAELKKL